jgi:hypothetical protein
MKPFSHTPGISALIPGTPFEAEVYPTLVKIFDLSDPKRVFIKEHLFDGPVKDFTVIQDQERGCLTLFAHKWQAHLLPTLELVHAKKPPLPKTTTESLFFGCYKKPEWEAIHKRRDFREIFPLWHHLGQLLSLPSSLSQKGMFALLHDIQKEKKPENVLSHFEKLFLAGFRGMLVPRLFDDQYQGIVTEPSDEISPLHLLSEGSKLIRALFLREEKEKLSILPFLPPQLFAGTLKNAMTSFGTLSFTWSKKTVRTLTLHSTFTGSLVLDFPSGLRSYRLSTERHLCDAPLQIEAGQIYHLDRFEG